MKRYSLIITCLVILITLVLNSCGTTTSPTASAPATTSAPAPATTSAPAPTSAAAQAPQYGGIFKIASSAGVTDIVNIGNPDQMYSGTDSEIGLVCGEALMGTDPTGKGQPFAKLSTGWQYNADYTALTLTLRKGVKFHDGTDFNADAAKFNLDMFRTGHSQFTGFLKAVSSVDVIDNYTIRLNITAYDPTFLTGFAMCNTWMTSPTAYKAKGGDYMATHPVGTGPFKFASYQRNVAVKFERFDDYWGGKPYLDGWEWSLITDPVTQVMSLKAGDIQALSMATSKDASDLKATGKYNVNAGLSQTVGIAGDSAHPDSPFADLKVRQAISYAIDTEAICKSVGYGFIVAADQMVPPGNWARNPTVVGYHYNLDKAKQLMAEAGKASGFETNISYLTGPENELMLTLVQEYLAKINIKVKLDAAPTARYYDLTRQGWNNQMVLFTCPASPDMDPGYALTNWLSKKAFFYSPKSLYTPDDYNTAIASLSSEKNAATRKEKIQALEKMVVDQCLVNPIWYTAFLAVYSEKVHDFDMRLNTAGMIYPSKVWMSK